MTHPFYDPTFDAFFSQQDGSSYNMNYTQAAPNNTLRYPEPNDTSVQVGPFVQPPWPSNGFNQPITTASSSNDIGFMEYGTVNTSPAEAEVEENTSGMDLESSKLYDHDHVQEDLSSPKENQAKASPCEGPSSGRVSRARHRRPINSAALPAVQCGWKGCTNTYKYTRDASLWRHIKEKHAYRDAFKCEFPGCKNVYGRMDKLQEHVRTVHGNIGDQNSEHCCSCHA